MSKSLKPEERDHLVELIVLLTGWSRSVMDNWTDEKVEEFHHQKMGNGTSTGIEGEITMQPKAIEKIKNEMSSNPNNPYVQAVGDFLLQHLDKHPEDGKNILATDKTVAKSLDEMQKVAQKRKVGNCAMLTDQEGFEVVLKYFDIKTKPGVIEPVNTVTISSENATETKKSVSKHDDFDLKLDNFL